MNQGRWITARYDGACAYCEGTLLAGIKVYWMPEEKVIVCDACVERENLEEYEQQRPEKGGLG